jgi:hypothetical protein
MFMVRGVQEIESMLGRGETPKDPPAPKPDES